jgi:uncharacterized membrane protein
MTVTTQDPVTAGGQVTAAAGIVRAASLLFTGLFAGFVLAVLVLEQSLRQYNGVVYTQVRQVELDSLDKLASATLVPALLTTAVAAVLAIKARAGDRRLVPAALALLLVVLVISLVINVPINGDQAGWTVQAPPPDWASVRDHWQLAHLVRTVAALLAFGGLVASAVLRQARIAE